MSEAVLASIRPEYCALIASGKKTIEVRKSKPKLDPPFTAYMYQTKGVWTPDMMPWTGAHRGKVIGEFVCDKITDFEAEFVEDNCLNAIRRFDRDDDGDKYSFFETSNARFNPDDCELCRRSCLSFAAIRKYIGYSEFGVFYGWNISDLKIYDKPRELSEFWKPDKCEYATDAGCTYKYFCTRSAQINRCGEKLTRPPQSWCYVEAI